MKTGFGKALGALALATSIGLLFQTTGANAGMIISSDVTELGLMMRENSELGRMPSMFYAAPNRSDSTSWRVCKDVDDPICTTWPEVGAIANLAPCTESSQLSCIAALWAVDSSGKKIAGELVKNAGVDPRYTIDEITSIGFPKSDGMGSIWRVPGVINSAGTDTYFAATQLTGNTLKGAGTSTRSASFGFGNLIAGIMPIQEISANVEVRSALDAVSNPGTAFGVSGTTYLPDGTFCAATEIGKCFAVREFPTEYRFGLTIKLSTKQGSWFHGRIYLPTVTMSDWKYGQELSIEAEPVKVPSLEFAVPNAEIPKAARDLVINGQEWGISGNGKSRTLVGATLGSQTAMDLVTAFTSAYKDKSTTTNSYWSFRTLNPEGDANKIYSCSNGDKLAGLVTTNALSYSAGPPSFDKSTSSLNYKVASPHFEADGKTEALGSYDLALRSDVARCIYGFSSAPIKAEISITSQDGEKKVATTVINERNGWLYLSAKGFTFSSPVINVKLSQEAPVVVPGPTPSATKAAAKVVKITCVKGKTKKVVSGVKPVCPKGYKKA
jgi:hypothetical protein